MGKTPVLDRVAADLARGLTHPAIQRLSSLVAAYPTDLDLRHRLAMVHRRVGNRIQAGRWDYLSIGADPGDTTAFERAFPSAVVRLRAVRWPHRASAAATSYARSRLAKLAAAAEAERPGAAEAERPGAGGATAASGAPSPRAPRQSRTPWPYRLPRLPLVDEAGTAGVAGAARTLVAGLGSRSGGLRSLLLVATAAAAVLVAVGAATVIEWIVR